VTDLEQSYRTVQWVKFLLFRTSCRSGGIPRIVLPTSESPLFHFLACFGFFRTANKPFSAANVGYYGQILSKTKQGRLFLSVLVWQKLWRISLLFFRRVPQQFVHRQQAGKPVIPRNIATGTLYRMY
jgi:hypothetical protein